MKRSSPIALFETRLCTFPTASKGIASPDICLAKLKSVNDSLTHGPSVESLEATYSITIDRFFLRVDAGLQRADGYSLKSLIEGPDYSDYVNAVHIARVGSSLWDDPEYEARGLSKRSSMTFGMRMRLDSQINSKIDALWEGRRAQPINTLLKQSSICRPIGG